MELLNGYKLRTIVDDTAFTVSSDPAEHTFHPHANLHVLGAAYDLCCHFWALVQFDDGEHIGCKRFELFVCRMYNGIGYNCAGTAKLVIDNPATPATVRTECPWGEKVSPAVFTLRPDHVITLGDLSPETCDGHLKPSREYERLRLLRYRPH